jgi:hypothetical protein
MERFRFGMLEVDVIIVLTWERVAVQPCGWFSKFEAVTILHWTAESLNKESGMQ